MRLYMISDKAISGTNEIVIFVAKPISINCNELSINAIRDRRFNLQGGGGGGIVFVSFRNFVSDNTRVRILIFFVARSVNFFSRI